MGHGTRWWYFQLVVSIRLSDSLDDLWLPASPDVFRATNRMVGHALPHQFWAAVQTRRNRLPAVKHWHFQQERKSSKMQNDHSSLCVQYFHSWLLDPALHFGFTARPATGHQRIDDQKYLLRYHTDSLTDLRSRPHWHLDSPIEDNEVASQFRI